MKKWPLLLCLGLSLCLAPPASAQVPPDKALSTFHVVDGLELSLWASEPLICNPTCIDIDHKGRVWVCESVNYRCTLHHQPLRRPEGDRILILEDSEGTGHADKVTVFYQAPEILAPLGIAVAKDPVGPGYKVYVCQSPDILVFDDKDGDGKADGPPKKLLSGFRGIDNDHGVHGILIGPDMKFYFSVGDQGVQDLQSADGKGRKWTSNEVDCKAGTIWRCDLDGTNLKLIADNFRNEYEPCVDSFGTVFVSDNDDDGNQQTRICYVMPGGDYGYYPRGPGQSHWHEEQPGVVPKILRTYFGSPTGMCVYEGTLLPKKYWGQLLHTDAGPRHVRCYHLTPDGAGYAVDREDMVTNDQDTWFRPSDVCVAPDGSVYVADWYDPGVGGHNIGDFTRGRIYRIAPPGNKPGVPKVDLESKEGMLAALASPNRAVCYMAMAKLGSMDQKDAVTLLERAAAQKTDSVLRARALWHLGRLGRLRLVLGASGNADPRSRTQSIRVLKDFQNYSPADYPEDMAEALLKDPSAAVRREALLTLRDVDAARAKPLLTAFAQEYDGKDRFYLEATGIAVGHHDKARRDVILADFDKQFPDWNDKVADLVWELRPPQLLPSLEKRAADPGLAPAQRGRVIEILAAYDDKDAGRTLLKMLAADAPQDVREQIVKSMKLSLSDKWRDLRQSPELSAAIDTLLARPDTRATALALIQAAERSDAAGKVAALARDGKQPVALRMAAIQTLGALPSPDALTALEALLQADPADLRLEALKALAGSRAGAEWLLAANEKKELPDNLKADAGRLLRNSPYKDLQAKAVIAFPPPRALDLSKLPDIAVLAKRRGNAERGKQLLAASVTNDMQCLKCHTIRGVGGAIGPDLSVIGKKASRENLFESILYPSKAIADQYLTWNIETNKGLALSGLIVEETADHLTLRDANGKDTRIDKKDIDSRAKSPNSLMPTDIVGRMTPDDLVDMVEYLFGLKEPALALDWWHIAGPFANGTGDAGLDEVHGPEKGIDLQATYPGKAGPVRWRTVKPDSKGYVDLRAFLAPDSSDVVSYLYREIDSPADQEARVLLGTDAAARLWVNDAVVYTSRKHRPALPEEDAVTVRLKKGRNRLLLKIANGDGDHGFYLTILSEQELKRIEEK